MNADFHFPPIGVLRTPFGEKFGVPRQSGLIPEARAVLKLRADPEFPLALERLDEFSHLWIVFVFHANAGQAWRPTIRPPRVDAPRKIGVFASRSPHRPNPIGLSAVRLERIDRTPRDGIELHLAGVDFLDGTPVLDVKPYLPYTDRIDEATSGWVEGEIPRYPVRFTEACRDEIARAAREKDLPYLELLLRQTIELDPRPTSQKRANPIGAPESEGLRYGFRLLDFDVKWTISDGSILVSALAGC